MTERVHADERVDRLAFFDALTDLPNRSGLRRELDAQLARAEENGTRFAVLFLDLDGFKGVNDRFGHATGDLTLAAVAAGLRAGLREADVLARYGGDEFVALLTDVPPDSLDQLARRTAETVLGGMDEPLVIAGHTIPARRQRRGGLLPRGRFGRRGAARGGRPGDVPGQGARACAGAGRRRAGHAGAAGAGGALTSPGSARLNTHRPTASGALSLYPGGRCSRRSVHGTPPGPPHLTAVGGFDPGGTSAARGCSRSCSTDSARGPAGGLAAVQPRTRADVRGRVGYVNRARCRGHRRSAQRRRSTGVPPTPRRAPTASPRRGGRPWTRHHRRCTPPRSRRGSGPPIVRRRGLRRRPGWWRRAAARLRFHRVRRGLATIPSSAHRRVASTANRLFAVLDRAQAICGS